MTQRTLIVGAGLIGNAVGIRLAQQGHTVYGIRRHSKQIAACIHPLSIDLNRPLEDWEQTLPTDIDKVFISLTPNAYTAEGYKQCYLDNMKKVVKHYTKRLPRFYFLSSTAIYGDQQGIIDAQSPIKPHRWNGKILAEAERFLLTNTPVSIINSAGIYGMMRWRLFDIISGNNPQALTWKKISNRIHQEDLIRFITQLILSTEQPKRYILCDQRGFPYDDIVAWLDNQDFPVNPRIQTTMKQLKHANEPAKGKRCLSNASDLLDFRLTYPTYQEGLKEQLPFWLGWQKLSPFEKKVLSQVWQIPWGKTQSYRQIGESLGCRAYRAIGQVLRKNPCVPWIPCHRVIKSDGSIGGYMGEKTGHTIEQKRRRLAEENIIL